MSPPLPPLPPDNPYIGLRFFDEDTAHLFFGRDDYVADLVEKLLESRFLAVLGHSGSGKSSLVRAGLIPALRAEQTGVDSRTGVAPKWIVVKFRPETAPIASLARALDACPELTTHESEAILRRGPLGIVEAFERGDPSGANRLLLLADQFEELFRLEEESAGQPGSREEAAAFVRLLLHANRHPNIYVVLTMRSDYLKDCARYRDLPERINQGIFLVPRMQRDELELAIVGPAKGAGVAIDPPLVQRLLNDAAGPDLDHLPLTEHLLARIWEEGSWRGTLTIQDYESAGGWGTCLSQHADRLYDGLSLDEKQTCEKVFRRLTLRDEANRDVRSRATLAQLINWCDGRETEVRVVVNLFREKKSALLTPVGECALDLQAVLDITHESLIRNWSKLASKDDSSWIHLETEARDTFRGLERRARRSADQRGDLKGQELIEAENLVQGTFTEAWVDRYFPADSLQRVKDLVRQSVAAKRTLRWMGAAGVVGALALAWIVGFLWYQNASLLAERQIADLKRAAVGSTRVNAIDGLRYTYVPAGEFEMGCSSFDTECYGDERPLHRVQFSQGYWIGQTEVTQQAYENVMKKRSLNSFTDKARPVDGADWVDAFAYCEAVGLRLPTEAEWEYAARAGNRDKAYGRLDSIAWYGANSSSTTHPVATKRANAWGLFDMLGNVAEMTGDWYDPDYYRHSPMKDPEGPGYGSGRVIRGGSWSDPSRRVRVSNRLWISPTYRIATIGFRCAGQLR
jgi:formylglycine-generating enzyme required for sulfatase activity/energy-coupling factor transporter ATP-binding protein EcfA2